MELTLCDSKIMHILILIGAGIFVFLGSVHAIYTFRSTPAGGPMTPVTPAVREAMVHPGGLGLAPNIDSSLWRAWVGFNLSHSLGVVVIGLAIAIPALLDLEDAATHAGWLSLAIAAPAVYLALSVRYWFRSPTIGITVGGLAIYAGLIGHAIT